MALRSYPNGKRNHPAGSFGQGAAPAGAHALQWQYTDRKSVTYGPFPSEQMLAFYGSKGLPPATPVTADGLRWNQLTDVIELMEQDVGRAPNGPGRAAYDTSYPSGPSPQQQLQQQQRFAAGPSPQQQQQQRFGAVALRPRVSVNRRSGPPAAAPAAAAAPPFQAAAPYQAPAGNGFVFGSGGGGGGPRHKQAAPFSGSGFQTLVPFGGAGAIVSASNDAGGGITHDARIVYADPHTGKTLWAQAGEMLSHHKNALYGDNLVVKLVDTNQEVTLGDLVEMLEGYSHGIETRQSKRRRLQGGGGPAGSGGILALPAPAVQRGGMLALQAPAPVQQPPLAQRLQSHQLQLGRPLRKAPAPVPPPARRQQQYPQQHAQQQADHAAMRLAYQNAAKQLFLAESPTTGHDVLWKVSKSTNGVSKIMTGAELLGLFMQQKFRGALDAVWVVGLEQEVTKVADTFFRTLLDVLNYVMAGGVYIPVTIAMARKGAPPPGWMEKVPTAAPVGRATRMRAIEAQMLDQPPGRLRRSGDPPGFFY